ncbi:MAG TPA: sulfur carrier protein ThiS [Negativicutes bacterium]|nr:sulfur carrier protein ThiS [Negativicutes bacterium]
MMMLVNGEERRLPPGTTLGNWLTEAGLGEKHIVVELNEHIIPRDAWAETILQPHDRMEIVTFVGGG